MLNKDLIMEDTNDIVVNVQRLIALRDKTVQSLKQCFKEIDKN